LPTAGIEQGVGPGGAGCPSRVGDYSEPWVLKCSSAVLADEHVRFPAVGTEIKNAVPFGAAMWFWNTVYLCDHGEFGSGGITFRGA